MKKINKFSGIILALIFFSIFFLWGMKGRFWHVFTGFFPVFHLYFLGTTLFFLVIIFFLGKQSQKVFEKIVEKRYFILPPLSLIFSLLISFFVFQLIPHVIDASHFLWTSRLILQGKLSLPQSPFYEIYRNTFNVLHNHRYFSLFLPGFSFFMAPFTALGIEWLFDPLSYMFSVILIGKIADKYADKRVSFFAMFLATVSYTFLFLSASFMTHSFNMFLTLLAIYVFLKDTDSKKYILISSILVSILIFIRPQNALFTIFPFGFYILFSKNNFKEKIKNLIILATPFSIMVLLLLIYNYHFTGSFFKFPQDIYFLIREPYKFCHRLGIGKGCPNTEGIYLPKTGLTWTYAFWVMFTRISLVLFNVVSTPLLFLFLPLIFVVKRSKYLFISSFFLFYFIGYFFFYLPGNLFGPRYFSEVVILLLIPISEGFFLLFDKSNKVGKSFTAAIPIAGLLMFSITILPTIIKRDSHRFWNTGDLIAKTIKKNRIKNSLIFIPSQYPAEFLNLQTKPPFDKNGNLILKDLGKENSFVAEYYFTKGNYKNAYVVDYEEKSKNKIQITELFKTTPFKIWIEFEDKRKPLTGKPDYAVNFATSEARKKKFYPIKTIKSNIDLSRDSSLAIYFKKLTPQSYYDFSHPILSEGEYFFRFGFISDFCGNDFDFYVNNKKIVKFSNYSKQQKYSQISFYARLKKGINTFKLVPKKNKECIIADYIFMKKVD